MLVTVDVAELLDAEEFGIQFWSMLPVCAGVGPENCATAFRAAWWLSIGLNAINRQKLMNSESISFWSIGGVAMNDTLAMGRCKCAVILLSFLLAPLLRAISV